MRVNRHFSALPGLIFLFLTTFCFQGCQVYTVSRTELEAELKPARGLPVAHIYRKAFRNSMDTLFCHDDTGRRQARKVGYDARITVVTRENKAIRYYARTLYIYKDEFLIGERTAPRLRGPNYFPVRLSDIARIEMSGF